jgi:hypothetical protein
MRKNEERKMKNEKTDSSYTFPGLTQEEGKVVQAIKG